MLVFLHAIMIPMVETGLWAHWVRACKARDRSESSAWVNFGFISQGQRVYRNLAILGMRFHLEFDPAISAAAYLQTTTLSGGGCGQIADDVQTRLLQYSELWL